MKFVHFVDRYLMTAFFPLYCHEITDIYFYYEMYRVKRFLIDFCCFNATFRSYPTLHTFSVAVKS